MPLIDMPIVMGVQAKMCHAIASIYRQDLTSDRIGEILSTLGIGLLGRLGSRELLKVIPGFGSAVAGLYAAATTYGLGVTLAVYFDRIREGTVPSTEEFRKIYEQHYQEGRDKLRAYLIGMKSQPPRANP